MQTQRRVFLKVLATGPIVGCAGTGPESPLPSGSGGEGSSDGAAGSMASSAGKASSAGGSAGSGGSPLTSHGGSPSGGSGHGGTSTFQIGGTNPGGTTGGSSFVGDGGKATGTSGSTSTGTAGTGVSSNPNLYAAGNVSDVPLGSLVIAAGLFLIGHDAQGIYAMSMQCPHKGCAVVFEGERLDCPCHHSKFDRNGNVLVGPATSPLPHLAVTIDGAGNIFVDKYATVGLSARTPV